MPRIPHRLVLLCQGTYYFITGVWPLLHVSSFEAVTGKKGDKFTLHSTGVMITAVGAVLMLGSFQKRPPQSLTALAVFSAVGLALLEIVYSRRIRWVYLADAVVQFGLVGVLLATRSRTRT